VSQECTRHANAAATSASSPYTRPGLAQPTIPRGAADSASDVVRSIDRARTSSRPPHRSTQHLRPALDAVGVTRSGTGWHSLQHLYATRLLVAGQPVSVVSALLGHSDNGATVMRVYSHVLTSDLPSGAAIAAALGGATG